MIMKPTRPEKEKFFEKELDFLLFFTIHYYYDVKHIIKQ